MAALAPLTVANLATTGNLNITGTASTAAWTAPGVINTGNLAVTGTSALIGLVTASAGINLVGNRTLNFGSDQTKATNAGSIGYQVATAGALDVYGAGTAVGSRNLQLWDNITVPGISTFTGKVNANGGAVVTGGLTVDGQAVTGGPTTFTRKVPWTNVSLAPETSTQDPPLQCSVDALGTGRLRGAYFSASDFGIVQATIPAGARPYQQSYCCAATTNGTTVFRIDTNGNMTIMGGRRNTTFYFDMTSYNTTET